MRRLLLLFCLLAFSATAEVIAGRSTILFHDAWTPIGGGPLTKIGRPITSGAFDGERFLITWRDGDVVWLALWDEGADVPWTHTSVSAPGDSKPFVRWNGTFYVLVVEGDPTYVARVSRHGVIESSVQVPQAKSIVEVAASPFGVALLSQYETNTHAAVLDVVLLDSQLKFRSRTPLGTIVKSTGFGTTYIDAAEIAPFGNIFYAVWREGRTGRYDTIVGTRVLLDGSAPDLTLSPRERNSVSGRFIDDRNPFPTFIGLHQFDARMAVIPLRLYGYGITATFIQPDGSVTETDHRIGTGAIMAPAYWSVRLLDGSVAVVYERNGVTIVRPFLKAPARRRSAGH
jgi:hypothetical protein